MILFREYYTQRHCKLPMVYFETSVKLRPLAQLFVALEFNASKYYKYSCGLNFRAPAEKRFDLKLLVLQRSHFISYGLSKFMKIIRAKTCGAEYSFR